ncbi:MAG: 2-succinyl-6-hydroxy-2,4-cyclohexadiene-1-carboxylate synthase [Archangium sp.]|nr:2-succinyl-6-hydroxy-2,4-cyclohexadiene-1-carboxylate synthase [Archangium sp.]
MSSRHTWGNGPMRALFLHGFTGGRHSFDHLAPLLGDALTATCVDLPGHGAAPLPQSTDTAGFLDVIEQLQSELTTPTVVIGYSQGARLALALAVRHPALVSRLVLESGNAGLRQRHARALRRASDEVLAERLISDGVARFVEGWEQLPLFKGLRTLPEAQQRVLHERRIAHTAKGLAGALRCMGQGVQPDDWHSLPSMHVPTLVLCGAADAKYTRIARRLCAELPLAWRVTLPGVGHVPHLEAPEAYAAELRSFLSNHWTHEPRAEELAA